MTSLPDSLLWPAHHHANNALLTLQIPQVQNSSWQREAFPTSQHSFWLCHHGNQDRDSTDKKGHLVWQEERGEGLPLWAALAPSRQCFLMSSGVSNMHRNSKQFVDNAWHTSGLQCRVCYTPPLLPSPSLPRAILELQQEKRGGIGWPTSKSSVPRHYHWITLSVAGTFCSTAQLLRHLHLQLPHTHLTIFIFALSDNAHTQMQVMLHFCFIHSPLKIEKAAIFVHSKDHRHLDTVGLI